ncbi:actin-related protein 6-like isoform X2 [Styela clava]
MEKQNTVVLDIGACNLKIGTDDGIRNIPNCIFKSKMERRKSFISGQIDSCKDHSGLFYLLPFQKGYLVNWDVQKQVWDYAFGKDVLNLKPADTSIILTEPHFNFPTIQEAMNEIFFEEYEFQSILRTNATTLSYRKYEEEFPLENCCIIVDAGYSFTHIVPYHAGKKITSALCRIDVGGKLLTNHLKEIISYRQLQVMDETYVMNQKKGAGSEKSSKTQEQTIRLAGERISVPEVLFHPSDIGIPQMGIPEAIVHSIEKCPEELRPHMYRNIVLTGGSCNFKNSKERVEREVRSLTPSLYKVRVTMSDRPQEYACAGGLAWSTADHFREHLLTLEEYQEAGQSACQRQFIDI